MKRIILLFLLGILPFCNIEAFEGGEFVTATSVEGFEMQFRVISGGSACEVHSVDKSVSGTVTIPQEVEGLPVIHIAEASFKGCIYMEKVIIPEGVSYVGNEAFQGCEALKEAELPSALAYIGRAAFMSCMNLSISAFPNSLEYIRSAAFYGCKSITSLVLPKLPCSIQVDAFYGCPLESITSPVFYPEYIDDMAFAANTYENATLIIPQGSKDNYLEATGWRNFQNIEEQDMECVGNSPLRFRTTGDKEVWAGPMTKKIRGKIIIPETVEINGMTYTVGGLDAFTDCKAITEIVIPKTIESYTMPLFGGCESLKTITVDAESQSLKIVDESLLSYDGSRFIAYPCGREEEDYLIPEGVVSLSNGCFAGCKFVKNVTIPGTTEASGSEIFNDCSALSSITVKRVTPPAFSVNAFSDDVYQNVTLYVPKGREEHFEDDNVWGKFSHIVGIEMDGIDIGDSPFDNIGRKQMILAYSVSTNYSDTYYGGLNPGHYKACIGFSQEQMKPYAGNKITMVRFAINSTNIQDVKIWAGSTRSKEDLMLQSVDHIEIGWNEIAVDKPFDISGDSIFIGIMYNQPTGNYFICCNSQGVEPGSMYMYGPYEGDQSKWIDGNHSMCFQCLVEGDYIPQYDIHTVSTMVNGKYFKGGEQTYATMSMRNWGKKDIESYELSCLIDGIEIHSMKFHSLKSPLNSSSLITNRLNFQIPEGLSIGTHEVTLAIKTVNGLAPDFADDDSQITAINIYSEDLGRQKLLLQHYTGAWCQYCPRADRGITEMMKQRDDIALVSSHDSDDMSCEASEAYCAFTNSFPQILFDRYAPFGATSLVYIDPSTAKNQPSFATVDLSAAYDEDKRTVHISVEGKKNDEFNTFIGNTNLTVLLTEDNIIHWQIDYDSGGMIEDYVHQGVLRTNVSAIWGDSVKWNGDQYKMEYDVRLDEKWVKDNMKIVAFLGKPFNGSNYGEIHVVNCNDFALKDAEITSGIVQTKIFSDSFDVFTLSGMKVRSNVKGIKGLPKGIYLVNGRKVIVD